MQVPEDKKVYKVGVWWDFVLLKYHVFVLPRLMGFVHEVNIRTFGKSFE